MEVKDAVANDDAVTGMSAVAHPPNKDPAPSPPRGNMGALASIFNKERRVPDGLEEIFCCMGSILEKQTLSAMLLRRYDKFVKNRRVFSSQKRHREDVIPSCSMRRISVSKRK
jgi:hypothetical protein